MPIGNFVLRQAQVALHVHVRTGRIVAEQSMTFTAENETRRGLTLSLGAPRPESSWSLPGVVPEDGALHSVLVANFDPAATEVEISPRSEQQPSASPKKVPVGGRSVAAVDLASLGGSGGPFAVDVRTTTPVVGRGRGAGVVGAAERRHRVGDDRWRAPCRRGAGRLPSAGWRPRDAGTISVLQSESPVGRP